MYGLEIKKHLDNNGIKYSYLSKLSGISLSTLSAMLNGKRKINVEEYILICQILNIDLNYFTNLINSKA